MYTNATLYTKEEFGMNLLQRRLLAEFSKVFTLSLAILLLFILMGQALRLRDMLLGLELGLVDTLRLFAYLTPSLLQYIMPVACMLAVFLTFLRMSSDREPIALKAGGVSLYQMLPAPLAFSGFCALVSLWITLFLVGWGAGHFRAEVLDIASSRARVVLRPGVFNQDIPNKVFFARRVDPERGILEQVLVEDKSRAELRLTILAPHGRLGVDYTRGELLFLLKNGRIYTEREDSITTLGFEEYVVRLQLNEMFESLDLGPLKPREMTWEQLVNADDSELARSDEWFFQKVLVERHSRVVFPLACILLSLIAIPVAVSLEGVRRQSGMVMGLVIFLLYYTVLSAGMNMGKYNGVNPLYCIWLPNLAFLLSGLEGIHLAAQERMPHALEWLRRFRQSRKRKRRETRDNMKDKLKDGHGGESEKGRAA